jgi:glycosyltransferase involved in cell wall biosynthesis
LFLSKVKRSKKGVSHAIAAAKLSKKKLLIAGGYRVSSIETWLPFHPRIKSVGYVQGKEKIKLLQNAKALIFPVQWEEPFGLVMIEAMACGTPVFGTKRGSLPEIIEDGVTGYLINTDQELADKMNDSGQLSSLACRERVERLFSEEAMYHANLETYRDAINGMKW